MALAGLSKSNLHDSDGVSKLMDAAAYEKYCAER